MLHPRRGSYSFLLGQTSVLDRRYLADFLRDAPRASLEFIGEHKPTCEDLTLHFFVSNKTTLPPIVFEDLRPWHTAGPKKAQMHTSVSAVAWNKRRERCLGRLKHEFGGMPLVKSVCRVKANLQANTSSDRSRILEGIHPPAYV